MTAEITLEVAPSLSLELEAIDPRWCGWSPRRTRPEERVHAAPRRSRLLSTPGLALIAATGAVSGMSESAALGIVSRVRDRIRVVFGGDPRSQDALDRALEEPGDEGRIQELAAALVWYARRDQAFREELVDWGREVAPAGSVTQNVQAGRDAYTAGRDLTVQQRTDGRTDERE